ncbi:MAG: tRNA-modifying protein YgfZ [Aestuariibacter sp.]
MTKAISLTHLAILKLTGEDVQSYLQGQITTDLQQLTDNTIQLSAQCDSKGKTWATFFLFRESSDFYLVGSASALQISLRELKKYAVFSKVDINDVTEQFIALGVPDFSELNAFGVSLSEQLKPKELLASDDYFVFRADSSSQRHIAILSKNSHPEMTVDTSEAALSWWQAQDAQAGLPMLDAQTSGEFVPQMMNLQALGAISFTKGCYMGQETVARTKYLGKNKRAGYVIKTAGQHEIASNEVLEMQLGESWRRGGTLLFSGYDDTTTWGFAVLPNDVESEAVFRLKSHPEVTWQLSTLPYSLDDSA